MLAVKMLSGKPSVAWYAMQGTHAACEYYSMVNKLVEEMIVRDRVLLE